MKAPAARTKRITPELSGLRAGKVWLASGLFAVAFNSVWAEGATPGATPAPQSALAASTTPIAAPPTAAASKSVPARPAARSGPSWSDLTAQQRQNLKPLSAHWDAISEAQKRKWLEISRTYPSLPPEGQATMHSRMTEWVGLTSQQRAQARLNFAKARELSKELTPEEKKAKWEIYQALSAEEKQKLAAKAAPRPAGAATAIKPVAPQKLAVVPARQASGPRPAASRTAAPVSAPQNADAAPKIAP